jgi:hypothetical protein
MELIPAWYQVRASPPRGVDEYVAGDKTIQTIQNAAADDIDLKHDSIRETLK